MASIKSSAAGVKRDPSFCQSNGRSCSPRSGARCYRCLGNMDDGESAGASGLPAVGEAEFRDRIAYGIPDILGRDRSIYAGRKTLVIGSGHSAANALLELAQLAENDPRTSLLVGDAKHRSYANFMAGMPTNCRRAANSAEMFERLSTVDACPCVTGFAALALREESDGS